jgi:hypothetical protein
VNILMVVSNEQCHYVITCRQTLDWLGAIFSGFSVSIMAVLVGTKP